MKMIKISIKSLFLGLIFIGGASAINAQTTPTDSAKNTTTTAATTQATGNPTIDGLKKQIEANPKDTDALAKLATAYQEASDWTNAIDTWKKISVLLPDWAPSYYSQAYAYQSAKDDANAKLAYEKYVATVKPEEVEQNKKNLAYAYFYIAFAEQQSNPDKAKEHIAKSLQYDPTNQDAIKLSKVLNS
ncbi:Tetratricopeptide repeat-containing protein [Chryseobacterium wanjuense]|uniref:Tetratricopeptide repeat-containing protein n=1 Tax=Chryseobacterium wanjuense TaxID=356305 RepID=A0A1I0P8U0_9FLAO|nr:tetratricopeptide repeat protein [Chryseobacterium wanjuense]SEW10828.1 Tetratricopeptide repeat-containing protein [Chryseobacterium wanjuense]